jgi:hypothetical protein
MRDRLVRRHPFSLEGCSRLIADAVGALGDLVRAGDVATVNSATTLLLATDVSDSVRASALFHRSIALALSNDGDGALGAAREARRLDPERAATWLGLLVELALRHAEVVPLSQALTAGDRSYTPRRLASSSAACAASRNHGGSNGR